jgi:hypothetical protein
VRKVQDFHPSPQRAGRIALVARQAGATKQGRARFTVSSVPNVLRQAQAFVHKFSRSIEIAAIGDYSRQV